MIDGTGRSIDYLRISITDRCNLRCIYCMPENGICEIGHAQILSFEEILRLVRIMTGLGVKHIRLTGGEPMVRRGCLDLARRLNEVPGVESISMTSNGIMLKDIYEYMQVTLPSGKSVDAKKKTLTYLLSILKATGAIFPEGRRWKAAKRLGKN